VSSHGVLPPSDCSAVADAAACVAADVAMYVTTCALQVKATAYKTLRANRRVMIGERHVSDVRVLCCDCVS
jgi:hypothetical protein